MIEIHRPWFVIFLGVLGVLGVLSMPFGYGGLMFLLMQFYHREVLLMGDFYIFVGGVSLRLWRRYYTITEPILPLIYLFNFKQTKHLALTID